MLNQAAADLTDGLFELVPRPVEPRQIEFDQETMDAGCECRW